MNNLTTRHIVLYSEPRTHVQLLCNIFIADAIRGRALIDPFMFPPAISRRKYSVFWWVGRSIRPSVRLSVRPCVRGQFVSTAS